MLIKCPTCKRVIGEKTEFEGLIKVLLPGLNKKHFIYVKEPICECNIKTPPK
jgi:hypothetical protein